MFKKNILKILIIIFFAMGIMNFAYADTGPVIGSNQAQKIAQNYLDTHNFPYKAITPHDSNFQVRVKDKKSEKVIWVKMNDYKEDSNSAQPKYADIEPFLAVWMVQVQNHNGKHIGSIYVNGGSGEIVKTLKSDPTILTDNITNTNNNTSNITTSNPPQTNNNNNNNLLILVIIIVIIGISGMGYWFYIKK